ncbi:hypothetical protein MNBD_PLANCTO02-2376 [hydrothermal vent metagenome]|uniref:Uncharacterized protein n=1 Tax=hydrothermal vent metagenome TaxID=652676 RepID=A0A3B1D6F9_9ZZZZ
MKNHILYFSILFFALASGGCTPPPKVSNAEQFEQRLQLKNSLQAVMNLSDKWDTNQKANLIQLIQPIAEKHDVNELRNLAAKTIKALQKTNEPTDK